MSNANDKVFEVVIQFNPEKISEKEMKKVLSENFDEDYVIKEGPVVTALVYIEEDPYTDFEDSLHIIIGDVLAGGSNGALISYKEVVSE